MICRAPFVGRFPNFQNLMKRGWKLGVTIGIGGSPIPFLQPAADRLADSARLQLKLEFGSTNCVLLM